MKKTYYLNELKKQGLLPELLKKLDLPSEETYYTAFQYVHECTIKLLPDSLTITDTDTFFPENQSNIHNYEMNDFMFLRDIYDPKKKKLKTLFTYMKKHFDTYVYDCLKYLDQYLNQERTEIEEEIEDQKCVLLGYPPKCDLPADKSNNNSI